MRLLFVSALYAPEAMGGAEITLARLADGLQTRGHDVAVLTTGRVSADAVLATGVRVLRRRIANIFPLYPDRSHALPARIIWQLIDAFNPLVAARVAAAIGDVRPDVVVTDSLRGFSVSAWSAAARAGVPIVHRICDSYLLSPSLNLLFAPPISAARAMAATPASSTYSRCSAEIAP